MVSNVEFIINVHTGAHDAVQILLSLVVFHQLSHDRADLHVGRADKGVLWDVHGSGPLLFFDIGIRVLASADTSTDTSASVVVVVVVDVVVVVILLGHIIFVTLKTDYNQALTQSKFKSSCERNKNAIWMI